MDMSPLLRMSAGVRRTERNIYPSFARCADAALGTTAVIFYFEEGLFPTASLAFQLGDYRVLASIYYVVASSGANRGWSVTSTIKLTLSYRLLSSFQRTAPA